MSNSKLMGRLLQSTILVGAVAAAAVPVTAAAQDDVDTITVTGTLIRRADIEAPSPVSSISQEELSIVNTVNTEEFLNTLPQVVPGLDASSNNPGNGTATANLRGLGAQRTLVLVNSRRYIPFGVGGVVDLNTIPAALVERIDVVTGGASALYGSDAMAGVVNFMLRDDFQGLEIEATYSGTEQEDGQIFQTSVVAGGNFDDGRGNATFFAGYTDRQAVFQGDREFSAITNNDALIGDDFFGVGSAGIPQGVSFNVFNFTAAGLAPAVTTLDQEGPEGTFLSDPDGSTGGDDPTLTGDEFFAANPIFNEDGTISPFIGAGPNNTRYNYAPVNYLQLPQERYNLAAFVNYDITDTIRLNLRGTYAQNVVDSQLAPTPYFRPLTFNEDTSQISDGFRNLLESNGIFDPDDDEAQEITIGTFGRRLVEVGPRNSLRDQGALQFVADLEGTLDNGMVWTTYAQFARSKGTQFQTGNASISATQDAVLDGTCNFLGAGSISQECADTIARTGIINETFEQTVIGANIGGDLFGLASPAATNPVAFVVGVEYRDEFGDFAPDSVLGPDVVGFNQALPISGRVDVTDVFGEIAVPLVEGVPGVEELSLNGAYRHSDYSTIGGTDTYSVGAAYSPAPGFVVKGSYNRAVRAPNIGELFSPLTNNFPGAQDPCASAPNGSGQGDRAICLANGVPADAFNTASLQPNAQIEALTGGNPDLGPETADTFTVGFVAQPDFADGLTVKVDYFDIEIEDVVGTVPVQTVLNGCYVDGVDSFCDLIPRTASGQIVGIELNAQNLALLTSEGIDVDVDYSVDAMDLGLGDIGTFGFRIIGTYALENGFQALPDGADGAFFYDTTGFFGARGGVAGEPQPEWKHTAFVNYGIGGFNANLRWRYIGAVTADDQLLNENRTPDGELFEGDDLDGVGTFRGSEIGDENYFDFTAQYQLNDALRLQAGVRNLFDNEPPIVGDSFAEQANTYPATYDALGRRYFVGVRASF